MSTTRAWDQHRVEASAWTWEDDMVGLLIGVGVVLVMLAALAGTLWYLMGHPIQRGRRR